jgi:exopolysaccharide biosynthesis polyprenyl glycosylphosphotransferase
MIRRFSINYAIFSMIMDTAGVIGAMFLTSWLRPYLNSLPFTQPILVDIKFPLYLFFLNPLVWWLAFLLLNVYDGRRNLRVVDEFTSLTFGNVLATGLLAGILYLTVRDLSRVLFLSLSLTVYLYILLWRLLARILFPSRRNSSTQRKVLIVGRGPIGLQVEQRIRDINIGSMTVLGFLDDDPLKRSKFPDIIGSLDDIREVIVQKDATDVIIALPRSAHARLDQIMTTLIEAPIQVWVIPDYFHLALHSARIEDFIGLPLLNMRALALDEYQLLIKRGLDLVLVIPMIVLSLPLMAIIPIIIWLEDRGPALYRQERAGTNGKFFTMYKFRTMRVGADQLQDQLTQIDDNGHLVHKLRADPRVTRVGRFLRRFSLDELPQFYNVLFGNMSLVGPRPELPFLVERYESWQRKRFTVPQGMTGWWQIRGRSDKPMHLNTEEDLYYIQNYSIWLDIYILVQTLWIVLRGKGAY